MLDRILIDIAGLRLSTGSGILSMGQKPQFGRFSGIRGTLVKLRSMAIWKTRSGLGIVVSGVGYV
jgi:hypothetical protein